MNFEDYLESLISRDLIQKSPTYTKNTTLLSLNSQSGRKIMHRPTISENASVFTHIGDESD